jgi:hypothetical protein
MNPNGFVPAASMTSHTSTPSLSQTIAISFTMAMFTARKVFSRSFTSSAVSVDETGTTVSMHAEYSSLASSVHAAVMPPTTFGVFFVWYTGLPGSTRSGLNARKTSCPTVYPSSSSVGWSSSRVVPGYVVLSSTISRPVCAFLATVSRAAST